MKKLIILLLLISLSGCSKKSSENTLFVSVLPLKFFTEQIVAGDAVVKVMVPPGMSPATYEPLPAQIVELSTAKLLLTSGVPFEKIWLQKIGSTNPTLKIRETFAGIDLHEGHSHGEHEEHLDPHIWTDPLLAKQMSGNIFNALVEVFPDKKEKFQANLENLNSKLDSLHNQIGTLIEKSEMKSFMIFHPALGYYAERYGLVQIAIEHEGKEPSPKRLRELISTAENIGITQIFVQEQFSQTVAESIASELNINITVIDPLSDDYINNMLRITKLITGAHK